MSGDNTVIESAAPPEVQAKAEKMGWIPPSRYRGDAERFVDAEEYVARGEQVLPIVRAQNQRLQGELEALKSSQAETQAALARATTALEEIEERHTVATQKAVEKAHKDLIDRLAVAHENGDHAAIAEITGLMIELKTASAEEPAKKPEPKPAVPAAAVVPPDLKEWQAANPWFGTDKRKTALALGVAQELRDSGTELTGVAFYEKVREEVEATLNGGKPAESKVEGARGSDTGVSRPGGRSGFAALPADAKAACDAEAKAFVGNGKRYKTIEDWRKRYAELYFQG